MSVPISDVMFPFWMSSVCHFGHGSGNFGMASACRGMLRVRGRTSRGERPQYLPFHGGGVGVPKGVEADGSNCLPAGALQTGLLSANSPRVVKYSFLSGLGQVEWPVAVQHVDRGVCDLARDGPKHVDCAACSEL
jgi:hypothetical protein